ncbi:MAG: hypothetical protein ABWK01_03180 [Infirmifilum sp.]
MSALGDLEVLFLLSFTDAPPSHVLAWLSNKGINYRFSSEQIKEIINQDEKNGTKDRIKSALADKLKELDFRLETFSSRVDSISEFYNITLLVAPVMLYSIGFFQPSILNSSLWALLFLNALLIFFFRDLHPRTFRMKTSFSQMAVGSLLPVLVAFPLTLKFDIKTGLFALSLASLPFSLLSLKRLKQISSELNQNRDILLRAVTVPAHVFRAVPPDVLISETLIGISRSVRLTLYLSSIWGIESLRALSETYEKIFSFYKKIIRKGFINAGINLVTIFLLGFASATVKTIFRNIPLENLQQWVNVGNTQQLLAAIDLYVFFTALLYALGLSILSIGEPTLLPLWLPPVSLTLLTGEFLGEMVFHG